MGLGISYRFNNFKNKEVLKTAEENDKIDRMLWYVKRLILKRDKLYNVDSSSTSRGTLAMSRRLTQLERQRKLSASMKLSKESDIGNTKKNELEMVTEFSENESDLSTDKDLLSDFDENNRLDLETE